ncbi:MAG: hypothetical protein ACKO0W_04615 [Planctomycetota bacterium]
MRPRPTRPDTRLPHSPALPLRSLSIAGLTLAIALGMPSCGKAAPSGTVTAPLAAADAGGDSPAPSGPTREGVPGALADASPKDQAFATALEAAARLSAHIAGCEAANKYRRDMERQWEGTGVELPPLRRPDPELVAAY